MLFFIAEKSSLASRLICPIVTALLTSQSHCTIILDPRTLVNNPMQWLCPERKQALAFPGDCRVEEKSPLCHTAEMVALVLGKKERC